MVLKVLGQKEESSVKWLQSEGPTLQPSRWTSCKPWRSQRNHPRQGTVPFLMGSLLLQPSLHGALGILTRALSSTWY